MKTTYVPFKGTGDMTMAVLGGHVDAGMSYTAFAINSKTKVPALAVAMDKRQPLMPEVLTFNLSSAVDPAPWAISSMLARG